MFFADVRIVNHIFRHVHPVIGVAVSGTGFAAFRFNVTDFVSLMSYGISGFFRSVIERGLQNVVRGVVRVGVEFERIYRRRSVLGNSEVVSRNVIIFRVDNPVNFIGDDMNAFRFSVFNGNGERCDRFPPAR